MSAKNPGNIFIISAASGTGKTTLVSRLLSAHADVRVSISHTTRAPREGERHGEHYYFVGTAEFEEMADAGGFLEHANVFGNYYGTSLAGLKALQNEGFDVILEIDVQGAEQVRRALPEAVGIFILPPSFAELAERLRGRGTDAPEVVEKRLRQARGEIEQSLLFDYIVVNRDLAEAEAQLGAIIRAHRQTLERQQNFIEHLLSENF
ncbi:guanylate kinase [Neisseria sp. 23W00296]|uniref:guanylate kinase n=1 Tax=unclassified Neisseria TaxID=2623750 RepID=UPI0002A37EB7|nr:MULTISPECIES: guanylate kinase [unclassified Neisseria]ASP16422.1 guanylate kinase [Neisseria sp. KEM232]EKY05781.1 guanylate kinase [Neisseria sp. oral taxon 020 str. F0370]